MHKWWLSFLKKIVKNPPFRNTGTEAFASNYFPAIHLLALHLFPRSHGIKDFFCSLLDSLLKRTGCCVAMELYSTSFSFLLSEDKHNHIRNCAMELLLKNSFFRFSHFHTNWKCCRIFVRNNVKNKWSNNWSWWKEFL